MRTVAITIAVLAFGVSFSMLSMSGFSAEVFGTGDTVGEGLGPMEQLNESANSSAAGGGDSFSGDVGTNDGDSNIISLVINGSQAIAGAAQSVVFLPFVLDDLGLPWFAAYPIGAFCQAIAGFGIIQFATGRTWR